MSQRLSRRILADYFVRSLQAGEPADKLVSQAAAYLVEARRTKEAALVVRDIEALLAESGTIVGTLTTAFDLDAETKSAIARQLQKQIGAETISLQEVIDPSVIGGYKVRIPGKELDHTVATQLTTLKTHFRKV